MEKCKGNERGGEGKGRDRKLNQTAWAPVPWRLQLEEASVTGYQWASSLSVTLTHLLEMWVSLPVLSHSSQRLLSISCPVSTKSLPLYQ